MPTHGHREARPLSPSQGVKRTKGSNPLNIKLAANVVTRASQQGKPSPAFHAAAIPRLSTQQPTLMYDLNSSIASLGFTHLPEPIPITMQQWPEGTKPLVHTRTNTYQHVRFIRDCIEGILMQKTTFPVLVLIHDDASTDGTAAILRAYEQQYPTLIRVYYQQVNTYKSKDIARKRAAFRSWRTGKYEAICEGDDYWTDPLKLQKQAMFLEHHPEYVACDHNSMVVNATGELVAASKLNDHSQQDALDHELKKGFWMLNNTIMYRNAKIDAVQNAIHRLKRNQKIPNGDTIRNALLGQFGHFKYMPDIAHSVYRVHNGGVWGALNEHKRLHFRIYLNAKLFRYFKAQRDYDTAIYYQVQLIETLEGLTERYSKDTSTRELMAYHYEILSITPVSGRIDYYKRIFSADWAWVKAKLHIFSAPAQNTES